MRAERKIDGRTEMGCVMMVVVGLWFYKLSTELLSWAEMTQTEKVAIVAEIVGEALTIVIILLSFVWHANPYTGQIQASTRTNFLANWLCVLRDRFVVFCFGQSFTHIIWGMHWWHWSNKTPRDPIWSPFYFLWILPECLVYLDVVIIYYKTTLEQEIRWNNDKKKCSKGFVWQFILFFHPFWLWSRDSIISSRRHWFCKTKNRSAWYYSYKVNILEQSSSKKGVPIRYRFGISLFYYGWIFSKCYSQIMQDKVNLQQHPIELHIDALMTEALSR